MSNIQYNADAQQKIDASEDKLNNALDSIRKSKTMPTVEEIPEDNSDVDVEIPEDKPEEKNEERPKKEPRRSEFVKTEDPKVQERINDLYGQVKKSDQRNQMIIQHNQMLEQKFAQAIEEIEKLKQSTKNVATEKVETELRSQLRSARENDDYDAIEKIEDKLDDLRFERRLEEKAPPKIRVPTQQPQIDTETLKQAAYVEYLAQERDQSGNYVRPYLYDWHPDSEKASQMIKSIKQEFESTGKEAGVDLMMKVLDERMGKKPRNSSKTAEVLTNDSSDTPNRNVVRLSQLEIDIAKKMGLTSEAYARQKQMINR